MKEKIKAHIHRQPAEWSRISLRSLGLRGPRESQIYNRDLPVGPGAEGLSARRGRQGPVPRRPHDVTAGASRSRKWLSQPLAPYSRVITKIGSYDSSSRIAQFYSKILQTMTVKIQRPLSRARVEWSDDPSLGMTSQMQPPMPLTTRSFSASQ